MFIILGVWLFYVYVFIHTRKGAGYWLLCYIADANVKKRKKLLLDTKKLGGYWKKNNELQKRKKIKDFLTKFSSTCDVTQFSTGLRNLRLLISVCSGVILYMTVRSTLMQYTMSRTDND